MAPLTICEKHGRQGMSFVCEHIGERWKNETDVRLYRTILQAMDHFFCADCVRRFALREKRDSPWETVDGINDVTRLYCTACISPWLAGQEIFVLDNFRQPDAAARMDEPDIDDWLDEAEKRET